MRLATILLILVSIASVASFPSVTSETFTTNTNVSTATDVNPTETVQVTTVTVNSTRTFWRGAATVVQGGGRVCYYQWYNVTISPGTVEVLGTIGPGHSDFNFYLMNPKQFQDWKNAPEACRSYFGDVTVKKERITSAYSLDWKNPSPGQYAFIFFDPSGSSGTLIIPVVVWAIINKSVTLTTTQTVTSEANQHREEWNRLIRRY